MITRPLDTEGVIDALTRQPTIDVQSFLINKGRAFTFSSRFTDTSNGDSVFVFVDNPDGSGFDHDVVLLPRATGLVDLNISFGATENDANAATAHNLKSGSSRSFSGSVSNFNETDDTGTAPAHGTTIIEDFIPGGGAGQNISAQVIDAVGFTIDEGSNKLIEISNDAGGSLARMAINVVVFEVDGTYKEVG